MRTQVLNALKQGIVRLRTKGGADPSTLYDLLNGYVTIDGSIKSRPGTVEDAALPTGTKGLCAFQGGLVVFSSSAKVVPAGYTCAILTHPLDPTQEIVKIHFAAAFLGKLYVVPEFTNGDVFHYWLLAPKAWSASTNYSLNDIVQPTVPNGFYFKVGNTQFPQAWQPNTTYAVGDVVVPTTQTGLKFTVIEADGVNPSSGATEPAWPTQDGATVTEEHDESAATPVLAPVTPPQNPGGTRYSNPGGSGGTLGTRVLIE